MYRQTFNSTFQYHCRNCIKINSYPITSTYKLCSLFKNSRRLHEIRLRIPFNMSIDTELNFFKRVSYLLFHYRPFYISIVPSLYTKFECRWTSRIFENGYNYIEYIYTNICHVKYIIYITRMFVDKRFFNHIRATIYADNI